MSLLLRISGHRLIFPKSKLINATSHHQPGVSASLPSRNLWRSFPLQNRVLYSRFCCSVTSDDNASSSLSDTENISLNNEVHGEKENRVKESPTSNEKTLEKLKRYGISGILSYGLLNTAYYLTTFLLVWFYFVPAPRKMGYMASVKRFVKVMAMVWAGSQVTKLARAGGALALAPIVDRGLSWFAAKYEFESREKAFFTIVSFCFGIAVLMFFAVTLISA